MTTQRFLGALTASVLLLSLGTANAAQAAADPCLNFIPKQYADADYRADAIYHQCRSLYFLKDLNALRARTDRSPLTPELIARARTEDFEAEYQPESIDPRTADGSPVPALRVNSDLNKWAQHRADALAAIDGLDQHRGMANGAPSWYVVGGSASVLPNLATSPNYTFGTLMFGPEALAWIKVIRKAGQTPLPALPGIPQKWNPVDEWYSELHATGTPEQLKKDRQAYGHYLTEVSHLVNVAGFGVAQSKNGSTVAVLEVGYIDPAQESGKGETLTVDEAIAKLSAPTTSTQEPAGNPEKDENKAGEATAGEQDSDGANAGQDSEKDTTPKAPESNEGNDADASTNTGAPKEGAHSENPTDSVDAGATNGEGDGAGKQGGNAGGDAPADNAAGQPGSTDQGNSVDQSGGATQPEKSDEGAATTNNTSEVTPTEGGAGGAPNTENSTTPDTSAPADTSNISGDSGAVEDRAEKPNAAGNANSADKADASSNAVEKGDASTRNNTAAGSASPNTQAGADKGSGAAKGTGAHSEGVSPADGAQSNSEQSNGEHSNNTQPNGVDVTTNVKKDSTTGSDNATQVSSPEVELSVAAAAKGAEVEVRAKGFTPGAKVAAVLHSDPTDLGVFTANARGEVTFTFRVPEGVPAGAHTVVLTEEGSAKTARVAIKVTQEVAHKAAATPSTQEKAQEAAPEENTANTASAALAQTGSSVGQLAVLSMGVLAMLGMALLSLRGMSSRGGR